MTTILNLTQHNATDEQIAQGVVEPDDKATVQSLLTFGNLPTADIISERANALAQVAHESGVEKAMIGGAPFFMSALENALKAVGVMPVYAFSVRQSIDEVQADGSVVKRAVFKHAGFVEV